MLENDEWNSFRIMLFSKERKTIEDVECFNSFYFDQTSLFNILMNNNHLLTVVGNSSSAIQDNQHGIIINNFGSDMSQLGESSYLEIPSKTRLLDFRKIILMMMRKINFSIHGTTYMVSGLLETDFVVKAYSKHRTNPIIIPPTEEFSEKGILGKIQEQLE